MKLKSLGLLMVARLLGFLARQFDARPSCRWTT